MTHSIMQQFLYMFEYPGDTRPEFKILGGASKSVFVLVLKICQHQSQLLNLHCDKHFYKSTPESLINV